jgi:hypothetical protein
MDELTHHVSARTEVPLVLTREELGVLLLGQRMYRAKKRKDVARMKERFGGTARPGALEYKLGLSSRVIAKIRKAARDHGGDLPEDAAVE